MLACYCLADHSLANLSFVFSVFFHMIFFVLLTVKVIIANEHGKML